MKMTGFCLISLCPVYIAKYCFVSLNRKAFVVCCVQYNSCSCLYKGLQRAPVFLRDLRNRKSNCTIARQTLGTKPVD